MAIQILPPDEAAKKAIERVAEWKRQRELDAAKERAGDKNRMSDPVKDRLPSPKEQAVIHSSKRNIWAHFKPENPEGKKKLDYELQTAAEHGSIEKARMLLDAGGDPNAIEQIRGYTSLMIAARYGKTEMVNLLLKRGASVNISTEYGRTALSLACEYRIDDPEIVKLLIEAGADFRSGEKQEGWESALMVTCKYPQPRKVEALLAAGADPNHGDAKGITPIMIISGRSSREVERIIQLLVEAGADVNARDKRGNTALDHAFRASLGKKNGDVLRRFGATR